MKKLIAVAFMMLLFMAGTANASTVLAQWDLTGKTGSEVSDAATYVAGGVTGLDLTKSSGLTASSASNGFGSTGWNNAGQYYQFGITVANGYQAGLTDLWLGTRSSATGPGTIGVYGSTDNFAHQTLLSTLTQTSATYVDTKIDLSSLGAITGSYLIRLEEIGTNSAGGGTTAGTGTFRVADYYDGSTYTPIGVYGTITATATPIPAAAWLFGSGLLGLVGVRRKLRSQNVLAQ